MTGFVGVDATASQSAFNELLAGPWQMLSWTLALLLTGAIIYGVQKGIERAVKVLMPAFCAHVAASGYNIVVGGSPRR